MRLLLSTAAFSAATGHTLLTPSLRAGLDVSNSAQQGQTAAAGAECLFVNSFRADHVSAAKSNDNGSNQVDTGILSCPSSYTCVEDSTSSKGGRCVSLLDQGGDYSDESYLDASHRSLVACTFANGTSGEKCVGTQACAAGLVASVSCGSCNGYRACRFATYVTFAELTCNGNQACANMYKTILSEGSCTGAKACYKTSGGDPGTVGTDPNGYTVIGKGSCVGNAQCGSFIGEHADHLFLSLLRSTSRTHLILLSRLIRTRNHWYQLVQR